MTIPGQRCCHAGRSFRPCLEKSGTASFTAHRRLLSLQPQAHGLQYLCWKATGGKDEMGGKREINPFYTICFWPSYSLSSASPLPEWHGAAARQQPALIFSIESCITKASPAPAIHAARAAIQNIIGPICGIRYWRFPLHLPSPRSRR